MLCSAQKLCKVGAKPKPMQKIQSIAKTVHKNFFMYVLCVIFLKKCMYILWVFFLLFALCCSTKKKFFLSCFWVDKIKTNGYAWHWIIWKKEGFFWIHAIINIAFSTNPICVVLRGTRSWTSMECAKTWLYSIKNTTTEFTNLRCVKVKNLDILQKYLLHKLQKKTMHFEDQSFWRFWNLSRRLHKRPNTKRRKSKIC